MKTKMEVEIEMVSQETIKPSSPTPIHLKNYKLSLLDQISLTLYFPGILFYPPNKGTDFVNTSQLLKQSLSETLTHFYPFAGKVKDSLSVDCNDEGAYYVESIVSCTLSQFLSQPDHYLEFLDKFFPKGAHWKEGALGSHVLMVQKSTFTCGGFAIGVLLSHRIADGTSFSSFMECWAALARKSSSVSKALLPNFDVAATFPQRDPYPSYATLDRWLIHCARTGKAATRRFAFDGSAIESLKAKLSSSSSKVVANPTRVEAVSALLWKCITAGFEVNRPTILVHMINLRRRVVPALPKYSFGNFIWPAIGECTAEERGDLGSLVSWLRDKVAKADDNFVNDLRGHGDGGLVKLSEEFKEIVGTMAAVASAGGECLPISSWCNFGLYDIDFGLGKPVWTSVVSVNNSGDHFAPYIFLMDMRSGKGVEAVVTLGEDDMASLERNKELLEYASMDPSPL